MSVYTRASLSFFVYVYVFFFFVVKAFTTRFDVCYDDVYSLDVAAYVCGSYRVASKVRGSFLYFFVDRSRSNFGNGFFVVGMKLR